MATLPNTQPTFKLEGGAKLHQAIADWSKQSSTLFTTLFLVLLVLFASYADQLPKDIRWQLSSTLGRLLLLVLLFIVYEIGGWISALLFTIGILVLWSNRPLAQPPQVGEVVTRLALPQVGDVVTQLALPQPQTTEGFQGRCEACRVTTSPTCGDKQAGQKKIKIQGSRWFVEEVLQEHPEGIEEDRVYTQAIQEDTYSPNTRTSR